MAQNIDEFKSKVTNFARPTLFRVDMADALGSDDISFSCKAANLPASTLGIIEVPYMGRKIKIAGDRTFAEWQITVMNEQSMALRKALEDWSNTINGNETNVGPSNVETYKKIATVSQLGTDGALLAKYEMRGVWPSEIGEIDLNWESTDTISEYSLTITYDYWTRIA